MSEGFVLSCADGIFYEHRWETNQLSPFKWTQVTISFHFVTWTLELKWFPDQVNRSEHLRDLSQGITELLGKGELAPYFEKQLTITASSQIIIKGRMKEFGFIAIQTVRLTKSALCSDISLGLNTTLLAPCSNPQVNTAASATIHPLEWWC